MNPVLTDPPGDPFALKSMVQRLTTAGDVLTESARMLDDSSDGVAAAWEGTAQRLFSLLVGDFAAVIQGSSTVASGFAEALGRYAVVLEMCQDEVRVCRQQLAGLTAATPIGFSPDPASVSLLMGRANEALIRATDAARELSATALRMMGGGPAPGALPGMGNQGATGFVSQVHGAGLASAHPAAAGFDVQAAHIQAQINSIMNRVVASTPTVVVRSDAVNTAPTVVTIGRVSAQPQVIVDPLYGEIVGAQPGQGVWINPNWSPPPSLVVPIKYVPFEETPRGAFLAAIYKTGNPALIGLTQDMYSEPDSLDRWIGSWMDDPGAIQPGFEYDTYNPVLDRNNDPYDNI